MGTVVDLASRRRKATAAVPPSARATCFVDLSCPFSYLAAERVGRAFSTVTWRLASNGCVDRSDPASDPSGAVRAREVAEERAAQLRLPLEWPDRFPGETPAAMRVASLAIEHGHGGEFILAAGRLAFCGGFDLEDPEILAEAAAAAQIDLDDCLRAARDASRDAAIEATSKRLLAVGADRLPALQVNRALLWGERRISAYLLAGPAPRTAVR